MQDAPLCKWRNVSRSLGPFGYPLFLRGKCTKIRAVVQWGQKGVPLFCVTENAHSLNSKEVG
jgi:hypothetical protein